jgi:hypothetical protein
MTFGLGGPAVDDETAQQPAKRGGNRQPEPMPALRHQNVWLQSADCRRLVATDSAQKKVFRETDESIESECCGSTESSGYDAKGDEPIARPEERLPRNVSLHGSRRFRFPRATLTNDQTSLDNHVGQTVGQLA